MRRKTSNIRALIPAMTEWTVEPGDKVRAFSPNGDPRDMSTDLTDAYLVPDPFIPQPSFIGGYVVVERFSPKEIERLEKQLEGRINEEMIYSMERSIDAFVCTVALQDRIATWREIDNQLRTILETANALISISKDLVNLVNLNVLDGSARRCAPSADQLVKKMILDKTGGGSYFINFNLETLFEVCLEAREEIEEKLKRGRKPETSFRLLLSRLVESMKKGGFNIKVPSNENVFDKFHPTFAFLYDVLGLCVEKGKAAIISSELEELEKSKAIKALSQYKKSRRAVVHYLRDGSLG